MGIGYALAGLERNCPARFDWSSIKVSLGSSFASYRDDPGSRAETHGLCFLAHRLQVIPIT